MPEEKACLEGYADVARRALHFMQFVGKQVDTGRWETVGLS